MCCEPTYEELKQDVPLQKIGYNQSCEPTYEELKRVCSTKPSSKTNKVASLPMRNWNQNWVNHRHCSLAKLRAYLWGIETHPEPFAEALVARVASLPMRNWNVLAEYSMTPGTGCVASLPMRNWNSAISHSPFSRLSRCEPTYEELKPLQACFVFCLYVLLRAYLWGIETSVFHCFAKFQDFRCEPTYEELKHEDCRGHSIQCESCEPTYEELKHAQRTSPGVFDFMLRAYLWGIETFLKPSLPSLPS